MRMPVLKHAKKKLRQDKKRTLDNLKMKKTFKKLIKEAKASTAPEAVNAAFSSIDKAAKKNIIHKNKAARLKSALAKVVGGTGVKLAVKASKSSKKAKAAKAIKVAKKTAKAKSSSRKTK
jgi:small subunit ribosomal protein S20